MILSASRNDTVIQAEDTEVVFWCEVDSNPTPLLALYTRSETGVEEPTGESAIDTTASFSAILTRHHNHKSFFCKATNEELQYTIHSNAIEFSVGCK